MNWTPITWVCSRGSNGRPIPNTGKSWNTLLGCRRVSPGCGGPVGVGGCYAERLVGLRMSANPKLPLYHDIARRTEAGQPQWTGTRKLVTERLDEPLRATKGVFVFANDMGDTFFEGHPFEDIAAVFGVMAAAYWHSFFVLTKREDRMLEFFEWAGRLTLCKLAGFAADRLGHAIEYGKTWPLPNVYLGVTVEDRPHGLPRIDGLRRAPAAAKFLSIEPQVEDLGDDLDLTGIDQVICGGESGPGARPYDLAWPRKIFAQAKRAGAARWMKQLGAAPVVDHGRAGLVRYPINDSHGADPDALPPELRVWERPAKMRLEARR